MAAIFKTGRHWFQLAILYSDAGWVINLLLTQNSTSILYSLSTIKNHINFIIRADLLFMTAGPKIQYGCHRTQMAISYQLHNVRKRQTVCHFLHFWNQGI